jgi:hypothetical protein
MPFVKATTTLSNASLLGNGNIGFTLGVHKLPEEFKYEDIYAEKDSSMPLVGYTYQSDGSIKKVYAINPLDRVVEKLLDRKKTLYSNTDFSRVPPPGITNARIGTNRNGLLADATLTISVPTLIQLETLHRTFLVPGLGMVLEWGQQFAPEINPSAGELSTLDFRRRSFPWNSPEQARKLLSRLALNQVGLEEILTEYVYPSQGQYMWMFGRIGSYNTKTNSDGSYECTVRIIGESENSFAYTVNNTVISTKSENNPFFCASKSNSVYSYFTTTTAGKNFKSLLDDVTNPKKNHAWKDHVFKPKKPNNSEGEPTQTEQAPVFSEKGFGEFEDSYFITWRFFVNVVLNDKDVGVMSIFKDASLDENELKRIATLLPYASGPSREITDVSKILGSEKYIDDPMESFVGFNKYLRSTDPSVMIIVNEQAASLAEKDDQYNTSGDKSIYKSTKDSRFMLDRGAFENSTSKLSEKYVDRGFLSSGVWINHKAIVASMAKASTIANGISNLLNQMNKATENYWQLTLDSANPKKEYGNSYNYMVVDANFKESSDKAVENFLNDVYTFNKYISEDADGKLVGSEVVECNIDLSLPKALFAQIGTLGLIQPEDLVKAEVVSQVSASIEQSKQERNSIKIADPNDAFRQMFAIMVLSSTNGSEDNNIDLTILPKSERDKLLSKNAVCASSNTNTTAETAGTGYKADSTEVQFSNLSVDELKKIKESGTKQLDSDICKQCKNCDTTSTQTTSVSELAKSSGFGLGTAVLSSTVRKLTQLTVGEITKLQSERRVFAVGKYQAIPVTFKGWVSDDNISPSEIFNSNLQERLGLWLLTKKRPKVIQYINGGNVTLEEAHFELAREFASIPVPTDTVYNGNQIKAGQSLYAGTGGNRSGTSISKVQSILTAARTTKSVEPLKQLIGTLEGSYDAINRGVAGDTPTNSSAYKVALNPTLTLSQATSAQPTAQKVCSDSAYEKIGKSTGPLTTAAAIQKGKELCAACTKQQTLVSQANSLLPERDQSDQKIRQFYGLQTVFRYVEIFPEYMVNNVTNQSNGVYSNAFGAAPSILAISADLGMPGINGLRVGELFWVDRIPAFYKAFGAFQIMSIEHNIGIDGWQTKIHAVFNYLGRSWLSSMRKILGLKG